MGTGGRWRKLRRVTGRWGGESCGVVAGCRRDGSWLGRKVLSRNRGWGLLMVLIARILIVRVLASTCGSGLGCGCVGGSGVLGRCTLSGGVGGSSAGGCALGLC